MRLAAFDRRAQLTLCQLPLQHALLHAPRRKKPVHVARRALAVAPGPARADLYFRDLLPRYPHKQAVTLPALHLVHDTLRSPSRQLLTALQTLESATRAAWAVRTPDASFIRPGKAEFAAVPSESVDYAVMEKCPGSAFDIRMVALDAGWNDLGAWEAVWQVAPKDAAGNAQVGDAIVKDSHNTLVHATSRLVSVVGLEDVVVVETPDAVMVADRARSQDVKKIVNALGAQQRGEQGDRHPQKPGVATLLLQQGIDMRSQRGFRITRQKLLGQPRQLRQHFAPERQFLADPAHQAAPADLFRHPAFEEGFCRLPQVEVWVEVAAQAFDIEQGFLQQHQLRLDFDVEAPRSLEQPQQHFAE